MTAPYTYVINFIVAFVMLQSNILQDSSFYVNKMVATYLIIKKNDWLKSLILKYGGYNWQKDSLGTSYTVHQYWAATLDWLHSLPSHACALTMFYFNFLLLEMMAVSSGKVHIFPQLNNKKKNAVFTFKMFLLLQPLISILSSFYLSCKFLI